jgi:hypothetical protein
MVSMRARLISAVLLAGCSRVVSDSMPQIDARAEDDASDGDAGGSACVALPLRAIDDDDSDTISDDVDTCFGVAGDVADADHDGIGDVCDAALTVDERFCMWTFRDASAGEDPQTWSTAWNLPTGWSVGGSALSYVGSGESAELAGAFVSAPGGIAVESHISVDGYSLPFTVGIELPQQDASASFACRVRQSTTTNTGSIDLLRAGVVQGSGGLAIPLPMQTDWNLRIALIHDNGKLSVRCSVIGPMLPATTVAKEFGDAPVQVRPRLFGSNGTLQFHHVVLNRLGI